MKPYCSRQVKVVAKYTANEVEIRFFSEFRSFSKKGFEMLYLFYTIGFYLKNCLYMYTFFLVKEKLRYSFTRLQDGHEVPRAQIWTLNPLM